ncbi:HNH/ENDO VII family nuclease [Burkholderia cepacia]|uniref:HNH/ENDO VII family nuclease n=1 Tax=Burkholderia cepacia TaxID=292 RepID=UPI0009BF86AE
MKFAGEYTKWNSNQSRFGGEWKESIRCEEWGIFATNLHHSNQDGLGSLFELSADTHQRYYGTNALHPYLPNAHPVNPVNRDAFNLDREAYWQQRAAAEVERRKSVGRCGV